VALLNGTRENIESDFLAQPGLKRAIETYQFLERETRDVYDGFAAGTESLYRIDTGPNFRRTCLRISAAYDVAAIDTGGPAYGKARAFLRK
jgi:hypothetical protein